MRLATLLTCLPGFLLAAVPAWAFVPMVVHDAQVELLEARLVVAAHGPPHTTWLDATLSASEGRFFIVLRLNDDSALDPAPQEWFDAVETATAPRILPPTQASRACSGRRAIENTARLLGAPPAEMSSLLLLSDLSELESFMAAERIAPRAWPMEWSQHLGAFVSIEYRSRANLPARVLLRASEQRWPTVLGPSAVAIAPGELLPLVVTSIGTAPVVLLEKSALRPEDLRPAWSELEGRSDYVSSRNQIIESSLGDIWLTEVVGQTHLYDPYFPDGLGEVPSLLTDFKHRLELSGPDCPNWNAAVRLARAAGQVGPHACASGFLAAGSAFDCPGADAPSEFDCGVVRDLALAFSELPLREASLVRQVGAIAHGASPLTLAVDKEQLVHSVKVYARTLDASECPEPAVNAATVTTGGVGTTGQGATNQAGSLYEPPEPREPVGTPERANHGACVWQLSLGDGCASDTAPDTEDPGCSGDSSPDSDGDTCAGDTNPSPDPETETCGGDSEAGSETDETTCSGDTTGDTQGDTCASDSPDGETACRLGRGRFPRPRMSVLTLVVTALLLPWRRSRRRRGAGLR